MEAMGNKNVGHHLRRTGRRNAGGTAPKVAKEIRGKT